MFSVLNTNPLEYNNDHRLPVKKSSKKLIKKPIIVGFGQADVLGFREREPTKAEFQKPTNKRQEGWNREKTGKQKTKKGNYVLSII